MSVQQERGSDAALDQSDAVDQVPPALPTDESEALKPFSWGGFAGGIAVVLALGIGTHVLTDGVPAWTKGTPFGAIAKTIEFPIYAILLGLIGNVILTSTGLRDRLQSGFRTEFFIKTGLVLLGASINFAVIVKAAGPAIAQAVLLISFVFLFTWWIAGRLGVDAADVLDVLPGMGAADGGRAGRRRGVDAGRRRARGARLGARRGRRVRRRPHVPRRVAGGRRRGSGARGVPGDRAPRLRAADRRSASRPGRREGAPAVPAPLTSRLR